MAGDDLYREYLVELYRHPHNFGLMDSPDVRQEGANPLCGDQLTVDLALDGDQVREARFVGKGCAVSIAAASILTDLAPSLTVPALMAMDEARMIEEMGLGALTPARVKCAVLALKTLQAGIEGASGPTKTASGVRSKRIVTTEEG